MKKVFVVALVVIFGALMSTAAVAAWTRGQGPGPDAQVDVNAFRNFQKETLPLRDEMAVKRLARRPMIVVTANPLIGPVPKKTRMMAATIPETCVSIMVIKALS